MSNFAIMRWAKNKFGGIASAEYHQRTELHKNCEHPELREYNITVKKCEDETLRKSIKKMLIEQQERTGRRVRKDATVMVDFVMTFSPEMIGKVNMDEWMRANVKWLQEEFGAGNLLRYDLHLHESTPHLHAFVAPRDEHGNFNFKQYVRHISQLVEMQDRYAKAMEPFGLERGVSRWTPPEQGKPMKRTDDPVEHIPLRQWRKNLLDEIHQMQESLKALPEIDAITEQKFQHLQNLEEKVMQTKGRSRQLVKRKEELENELLVLTGKKEKLESEVDTLNQKIEDEQKRYAELKSQAKAMSAKVEQYRKELVESVLDMDLSGPSTPTRDTRYEAGDDVLGL